jgi:hypothetical protein
MSTSTLYSRSAQTKPAQTNIHQKKRKFFPSSLRCKKILLLLSLAAFWSHELEAHEMPYDPYNAWWTGPLIATSARVVPVGEYLVEPYLFNFDIYGTYNQAWKLKQAPHNFYTVQPFLLFNTGVCRDVDFGFTTSILCNHTHNQSYAFLGDTRITFSYQICTETFPTPPPVITATAPETASGAAPVVAPIAAPPPPAPPSPPGYYPFIRFQIAQGFPTGKYDHLRPERLGTDSTGTGSFVTEFDLFAQKLFVLQHHHPLRVRINLFYRLFSNVHVESFNTYGGGHKTKGTVRVGDQFIAILAFELALTRNWVFAMDTIYQHQNSIRFKGRRGTIAPGIPAVVGLGSSEQFSITPSIEYNFNQQIGIIIGPWFTLGGRNAAAFVTPTVAVNIFF